jgi:prevent-host-death family protein
MPTFSATHAKQNFAAMIDAAQREPVRIRRHERDIAVLLSSDEYESLRRLRVQELLRLTEESGDYAESNGLTEQMLEQLMAEQR